MVVEARRVLPASELFIRQRRMGETPVPHRRVEDAQCLHLLRRGSDLAELELEQGPEVARGWVLALSLEELPGLGRVAGVVGGFGLSSLAIAEVGSEVG